MARNLARKATTAKTLDVVEAKAKVLELIASGCTVDQACRVVQRSVETYRDWRKHDAEFKAKVDGLRRAMAEVAETGKPAVPDFPEFCRDYLGQPLFIHQLRMLDVIEGREPRDLHDSMTYRAAYPDRVLINVPPYHAKSPLALDTPVATPNGWQTIGSLREGDQVFGLDGKPTTVLAKSPVYQDRQCFRLTVNDGESFVADAEHRWVLHDGREVSTAELAVGDRFPAQGALHTEPVAPPLDPYLLGCWLGDGHTACGRFTTADPEIAEAFAERFELTSFETDTRAKTYNALGLYPVLSEIGVRGNKFIPEGYLFAGHSQRLALLQGLMDTDGTISPAGQASFTSTNRDLAEGVLYLASSLGLRPTMKESRATLNGKDCGPKWSVWFSPCGQPVFRLTRKLARVRSFDGHTTAHLRKIVAIEPVESVPVQCIAIDNDSHVFLIGKSLVPTHNTTFTVNYVVWRIVKDPSIRVLIISEGMKLAQEFLYEIKQKLTSSVYQEMHIRFAPEGGFQGDEWGQTKIRVAGAQDDGAQKDPTVQALGMKGQIYGRRADLVIMDDTVTTKSAAMIDIQTRLIDREIESRLDDGAPLIVLGTRIAPHDLYRELIDQVDGDEKPIWTYFRQPAVLDYGNGDSATWTTLWPEKWPGTSLVRRKKAGNWNLVYQQMNVDDEMTFRVEAVEASINSGRFPGPLCGQDQRVRVGDLYVSNSDLYVVGGIDPASVGCTAMIVAGLHVESGKRFVLDGVNIPNCPPHILKENIKRLTDLHHINEWVIERNAFQGFLSRDRDLLDWLRSRGCKVTEHYTTGNKRDSDFGIATMGPLFDTCGEPDPKHPSGRWRKTPDRALIDLPSPRQNEWVHELTQQLTAWQPQGMAQHAKTDLVMALWFTHIRFTEILDRKRQKITHLSSPFLSRSARKRQTVINLAELRAEKRLQELEGTAV